MYKRAIKKNNGEGEAAKKAREELLYKNNRCELLHINLGAGPFLFYARTLSPARHHRRRRHRFSVRTLLHAAARRR